MDVESKLVKKKPKTAFQHLICAARSQTLKKNMRTKIRHDHLLYEWGKLGLHGKVCQMTGSSLEVQMEQNIDRGI